MLVGPTVSISVSEATLPVSVAGSQSGAICRLAGCGELARQSTGFSSERCEEIYFLMSQDDEEQHGAADRTTAIPVDGSGR
jgi:hypothetical protein